MSDDPMGQLINAESDAYGVSPARALLTRLFEHADVNSAADATEMFLKRLVVLEMVLEKNYKLNISSEEFEEFLARNHPEIQEETKRMAQLFYGKIASRPGG